MPGNNGHPYARWIPGTEEPGFSQELICNVNENPNEYKATPYPGEDTMLKSFKRTVKRLPDLEWLGSRNPAVEGRPYEWKTWK
jgi:hypothetical protein